jgi:hypothetical protein
MMDTFVLLAGATLRLLHSRRRLLLENLALRQQLAALKRRHPRPRLSAFDRFFWMLARRFWSGWKQSLIVVAHRPLCAGAGRNPPLYVTVHTEAIRPQFPANPANIRSPGLRRERTVDISITTQAKSQPLELLIFRVFLYSVTWAETR